ncbi:DUF1828 domain-containing protein [Campylobacter jejuni]
MLNIENLMSSYFSYIKSNFDISKIENNIYEITTPFLDKSNDNILFYIEKKDDLIELSDGGETLRNLSLSGFDFNSEKRLKELEIILNGFNIQKNNDILFTRANENNFAKKQHNLIQALISVNDMFVLAQGKIQSFFFDDVKNFFEENFIRYTENISLDGKSHLNHKFDFLITKSSQQKERLIKIINNPKNDNLKATLFSFMDLPQERKANADNIIIFNNKEGKNMDALVNASNEHNVKAFLWSKRKEYIHYLVA